jgi:DMSO reductase family type II enzyme chaperone
MAPPGNARHVVPDRRQPGRSAAARCRCYAACSELVASPHEVDVRAALRERGSLRGGVPQADLLEPALAEVRDAPVERLKREYSALFEVGDEGPPVPMREDLFDDRGSGCREEVVRFYEHFHYTLADRFAWQPAHLSVELEFVHLLCFRESQAADPAEALPYQLAQLDFCGRHLASWVPTLAARAAARAPGSIHARALAAVAAFLEADLAWQGETIRGDDQPGR